jgi:Tol biopolymer transport system component
MFSQDGGRVAYISVSGASSGEKSVTRVMVKEQGVITQIYSSANGLRLLGWASNDSLIFEEAEGPLNSYVSDVRLLHIYLKGSPRLVAQLKSVYPDSFALSSDGSSVAFSALRDQKNDIFVASTSDGREQRISSNDDPHLYFGSLSWSSDNRNVYYDRQERIVNVSMLANFN